MAGSIRSLRRARKPRKDAILVRSREPAVADDIGNQDRRDFPGSPMARPQAPCRLARKIGQSRRLFREPGRSRMSAFCAKRTAGVRLQAVIGYCAVNVAIGRRLCEKVGWVRILKD